MNRNLRPVPPWRSPRALAALPLAWRRLELSRAKHPSLAGHSRMAKRVAALVPGYAYDDDALLRLRRRAGRGGRAAARRLRAAGARCTARASRARSRRPPRRAPALSDLQFTGAYRVPFQFSRYLREHLQRRRLRAGLARRDASTDLDGNVFYDLTGSYGVNVFGYDFYKALHRRRRARVAERSGPVLGAYHPCVADNVERLRAISGLDEVSFHMSGTEAVMQAVRLARYHTRPHAPGALLRRLPRLVGGRAARPRQSAAAARDLHAAGDGRAHAARAAHARATSPACWSTRCRRCTRTPARRATRRWSTAAAAPASTAPPTPPGCRQLREVCTERGIVLIFDEVFVGFRLAPRRRAGVLRRARRPGDLRQDARRRPAGRRGLRPRATLMKRFREDRPADICFARGTFNSHPYVMGAMQAFLERLRARRDARALRRPRRALERRAPAAQRAPARGRRAGAGGEPVVDLDGAATPSRRATTGCCSTTCAPRAWR